MSEYTSNNDKYISFFQNIDYDSFKQVLYGSSGKNAQKACSMLNAEEKCNKKINKHKQRLSLKNNDYRNYGDNKNIRNVRQLYQEKTKNPKFDELQRISTCLTKLVNLAQTDQEKLHNRHQKPNQSESDVEETGFWAHSTSRQVQNNPFDFYHSLSFPEIYGNKNPTTFHDVNSCIDRRSTGSLGGSPELSECDKRVKRQRQSDSSDDKYGSWARACPSELQSNLSELQPTINLPLRTYSTIDSKSVFESITDPFKQPESRLLSRYNFSASDLPFEQQSQSESFDEMYGILGQTSPPYLQNNLAELDSKMNLPLRTCRTVGLISSFENIDNTFKQPENSLCSIPYFSGFDHQFEQQSQSDSLDEMYGRWAPTDPPDLQNNIAELEPSMNLPLISYRTIGSKSGVDNINHTFKQPESPLVSSPHFSVDGLFKAGAFCKSRIQETSSLLEECPIYETGQISSKDLGDFYPKEYKTQKYCGSDVFQDNYLLPIGNSFQERPTEIDLITDVIPSINGSGQTVLKCNTTNWDEERKRKEQHNIVERSRRLYINDRIKELGSLLPSDTDRKHKVSVLQASAEYIKTLKKERERLGQLEEKVKQYELHYKKLLFRIRKLERTMKCIRLKKSL